MAESVAERLPLVEFLIARVEEDEKLEHGRWCSGRFLVEPGRWGVCNCKHRRLLSECEATRRIVELHGGEHVCWQPDYPVAGDFSETTRRGDCATLRYLAAVYADHPDYRGEWRP